MKHDEPELDALMVRARVLRRRCVEAHNRLQNDSGHSVLSEVIRCVPTSLNFDGHCTEHRLLSCYAFWGCAEVGGRRGDFNNRLVRSAPVPIQVLHRSMRRASFGAWECCESSERRKQATKPSKAQWRSVGLDEVITHQVELLTNVDGERAYPVPGEIRVGWMVEQDERQSLLFSMSLAFEAATTLRATAEQDGWRAPEAPERGDAGGFRRAEYERDLVTLAVRPDFKECGLDRYYFLPLNQRRSFPSRFVSSLVDQIAGRRYHRTGPPWHVAMARATTEVSLRTLCASFDAARAKAGRSAGRYRGDQIDPAHLPRIAPDDEILAAFGLGPDGAIDLDDFLPIKMHLLEYLDLDDDWFEAAGLSLKTPIQQAQAHFTDENAGGDRESLALRLDDAIERHRVRLRWVALMRSCAGEEAVGDDGLLAGATRGLEPDYDELYEAAQEIFGATILERSLGEILARERRLTSRIESALVESTLVEYDPDERPLQVGDLPESDSSLGLVRGIGRKSVAAVTRCLREAMVGWADRLARPTGDSDGEAAQGIESGLDELDALFG
jgi:hypothetical protein